jgi:hypothetical protein
VLVFTESIICFESDTDELVLTFLFSLTLVLVDEELLMFKFLLSLVDVELLMFKFLLSLVDVELLMFKFLLSLIDVDVLVLILRFVISPVLILLFVLVLVDTLLLLFVLIDLLSTFVLLTFKLLLLLTLLLLTVLVDVELLFVSTNVFESYVVCACDTPQNITKRAIAAFLLKNCIFITFFYVNLPTPQHNISNNRTRIYPGKNLPIKPLTILSDKLSGKNFKKPKK